ncbi:MAG: chemotaxis protein CheW [Comamonadaceae bacterium]|nr:chemotaxis protein CheW [Comamonadaceae bacterium]
MTKREALRDLQNRLADRFQSARNEAVSASWLAVLLGPGQYLLPLNHSGEIFPLTALARVPYAAPWFAGVANLRGSLCGVVDIAIFLGEAGERSELSWPNARLVTFNPELDINCALMIDGLVGLRRPDAFVAIEPAATGVSEHLGRTCLDAEGRRWQELDLRALSQSSRFLNIGA